jgi:hypothetical protein
VVFCFCLVRPEAAELREGEFGSVLYFGRSGTGPAWLGGGRGSEVFAFWWAAGGYGAEPLTPNP